MPSIKVAALTSKFNAIIHENKGHRSGKIISNDPKKKLMVSQLATGLATNTSKRPPTVFEEAVGNWNWCRYSVKSLDDSE